MVAGCNLYDRSAVCFAEQEANSGCVRAGTKEAVNCGKIKVEFACPLGLELPCL
jgi:hypothetical protein